MYYSRGAGVIYAPLGVLLTLLYSSGDLAYGQAQYHPANNRLGGVASARAATDSSTELRRLRADAIAKMKESRIKYEQLLILYEEEQVRLTQDFQKRRELHEQGIIARDELMPVQKALAASLRNILDVKRWIMEDELAIAELDFLDELLRLPKSALGTYSERGKFIRFNGAADWSLAQVPKIEKFFSETFGKALPVSAYGQSAAHDRLRFDHREAIDVALHPDSSEGRSLISYLRQLSIPFIAFRSSVPGASTGAHIHIGRPSARH
jgi:hypothetical protein